ncbi:hypothetical protein Ae201684P_002238 [Aphanomyces euteiches]|nr:hypothetical protein Ae201684P_002238 [Aphanomyces euteiches]
MAKEESDYLLWQVEMKKARVAAMTGSLTRVRTHHMTNSMANFKKLFAHEAIKVHLADDDVIEAVGQGEVVMKLMTPQGPQLGVLKNVCQFATDGAKISFEKNNCIMEKQGRSFNIGSRFGKGLYNEVHPVQSCGTIVSVTSAVKASKTLVKNDMVSDLALKTVEDWTFCDSCALGKHARFKFAKKSSNRSTTLFEEISSDVCGPMQTPSRGGNLYFVYLHMR